MSQRSVAVAAGTVVLALAGLATISESPAPNWPAQAASASEPERVRIEHEIVQIPITAAPELRGPRAVVPPKLDRRLPLRQVIAARADATDVSRPARTDVQDEPKGLFSRTVHTIVGDGTHKPQPFPRPGG